MKLLPLVGGVLDAVKNTSAAVATGNAESDDVALSPHIDRSARNEKCIENKMHVINEFGVTVVSFSFC